MPADCWIVAVARESQIPLMKACFRLVSLLALLFIAPLTASAESEWMTQYESALAESKKQKKRKGVFKWPLTSNAAITDRATKTVAKSAKLAAEKTVVAYMCLHEQKPCV